MTERRTPLYDYHLRHAGILIKGGGDFLFPDAYTSTAQEHTNTRTNVGMQELSSMGEVDVKGPGAERLLNRMAVNEVRNMEPGQMRYTTLCTEEGGIVDDVTIYKFNDEHFMVVTSSAPRKQTMRWIADNALGSSAYVTDITAAVALIAIQGPRSRDLLRTMVKGADLDRMPFFRFTVATIGDTELVLSRSGYTGELGYELYTPADEAGALWEYLLRRGKEYGLLPYGAGAMQSLRIEKALPLYGPDISLAVSPFHMGLDRWIRFDKREFIGREALLRIQERGVDERWVGLVLDGGAPASPGNRISSVGDVPTQRSRRKSGPEATDESDSVSPGIEVGSITSSATGYTVGKTLALGFVRTTHAWPGSHLVVHTAGRPIPAKVATTPFFDPSGSRLRAKPGDAPRRERE
jgi:aminomethyltransferase